MRKRDGFADMLRDLLAPLGAIVIKPMFSGYGIYADGVFFALVFDGKMYLKSDEVTAPRYDAEGLPPYSYATKTRTVAMSYRQVPERVYDDPDEMLDWGKDALAAVRRTAAAKSKSPSSKTGKAKPRPRPPKAK